MWVGLNLKLVSDGDIDGLEWQGVKHSTEPLHYKAPRSLLLGWQTPNTAVAKRLANLTLRSLSRTLPLSHSHTSPLSFAPLVSCSADGSNQPCRFQSTVLTSSSVVDVICLLFCQSRAHLLCCHSFSVWQASACHVLNAFLELLPIVLLIVWRQLNALRVFFYCRSADSTPVF